VPVFAEEQRLPAWVNAVVLLPAAALGAVAVALWASGEEPGALVFTALALIALVAAVPNLLIRLVTTVDAHALTLRIEPPGLPAPFLPPRSMSVPLGEIARCEARPYRALKDREYWGKHFWGLGTGRRGRYIYLMNAGPLGGTGVELTLTSGDKVLVGSSRVDELVEAVADR
jgi:hypothetical protein